MFVQFDLIAGTFWGFDKFFQLVQFRSSCDKQLEI